MKKQKKMFNWKSIHKSDRSVHLIFNISSPIKHDDIVLFSRHLATMVCAGIPLVQALEIIARGQDKTTFQTLVLTIRDDIRSGKSFGSALSKHSKYFDNLFCNLIKVGEQSGTLDVTLKRLADYLEKSQKLKKRVQKALYYPISIMGISSIIGTLLLLFIVPQFERLFRSFSAELPLFTRIVINSSEFFQSYWFGIFFLVGLSIWTFLYLQKNSQAFNEFIDKTLLRIPIFGTLLQKSILARITRTMATSLAAGITLLEVLTSVASIANNSVYRNALTQVKADVAMGQQMNSAMNFHQLFPTMVVQMIAVGEESGTMDEMLNKVATLYEEDVENSVNGLSSLMEPIIIIVLGLIIGTFVLAMYLPIFRVGSIF